MADEVKWIAVMVVGLFGTMFAGIAIDKYSQAQVKIACYEAAKTNQNLKCEEKENK